MPSDRSIPHAGEEVFCHCPLLKEKIAVWVQKMKVNDRMEQHALSVVADAAGSKGYFISIVIDYGEELLREGHRLVNL